MKVIIAVILVIESVAALRSGPYLPSGWRPEGPAFYLPSEIQVKPAENPVKVTIFQENEASGSDSLREYGPPKLQEVTSFGNQGLPDIITDQIFQNPIDISFNKEVDAEQNIENGAITEEKSVVVENVVTAEPNIGVEKEVFVNSEVEKLLVTQSTAELVTVTQKVPVDDGAVTETASNEEIASTETIVLIENVGPVLSEPEFDGRSLNVNIQSNLEETTQIFSEVVESSPVTLQVLETTERVAELAQRNEENVVASALYTEEEIVDGTTLPTVGVDNVILVNVEKQITTETISEEKSEQLNNEEEKLLTEQRGNEEVITPEFNDVEEKLEGTTFSTVVEDSVVVASVESQISTDIISEEKFEQHNNIEEKFIAEQRGEEEVIAPELNGGEEILVATTLPTAAEDSVVAVNVNNQISTETISEEKSEQLNNVEEKLVAEVTTELKEIENVAVGVNNIAEALVKLENEIRAEQVTTEEKTIQEISGSLEQAPEGFLEYGPPGFKEYGPPNGDDLLKVLDQDIIDPSTVTTNELRKRRFSPRFRSIKKSH